MYWQTLLQGMISMAWSYKGRWWPAPTRMCKWCGPSSTSPSPESAIRAPETGSVPRVRTHWWYRRKVMLMWCLRENA